MSETDEEKKAKVLHTRVPESLENELKTRAGRLGLSVSTLVRNILGNALGLVEDIVTDSANIARLARGEVVEPGDHPVDVDAREGHASRPDRIIGWQEAFLNLNAVCDRCNALLPKGSRAGIAVTERPAPRTIICEDCLDHLIDSSAVGGGDTPDTASD